MISQACQCGGVVRKGICSKCGPKNKENRGNSHQQGYNWTWRKFSEQYRRENPFCVDCESEGRLAVRAQEVHHKIKVSVRPDLKYEPSNLMGLCSECHRKRTQRGE